MSAEIHEWNAGYRAGFAEALRLAAEVADQIAENPPDIDVAREYWSDGCQDGAMEVAAAIRELKPEQAIPERAGGGR